jgi:hypothetical protein
VHRRRRKRRRDVFLGCCHLGRRLSLIAEDPEAEMLFALFVLIFCLAALLSGHGLFRHDIGVK